MREKIKEHNPIIVKTLTAINFEFENERLSFITNKIRIISTNKVNMRPNIINIKIKFKLAAYNILSKKMSVNIFLKYDYSML